MTTTIRPARDPNFSTETIKVPAWKNIVFETSGASHLCDAVYPTEREARDIAERALADARAHHDGPDGIWFIRVRHIVILVADISHVIQIPWACK